MKLNQKNIADIREVALCCFQLLGERGTKALLNESTEFEKVDNPVTEMYSYVLSINYELGEGM